MSSTRILIVDDHAISRAGLVAMLASVDDVRTGQVAHPRDAPAWLRTEHTDLVIFNVSHISPTPLAEISTVIAETPLIATTPVLLIAPANLDNDIIGLLRMGAQGCVAIDVPEGTLIHIALAVAGGCRVYFPSTMMNKVIGRASGPGPNGTPQDALTLTPQERRVLALVARGLNNQEISRELCLSKATVKKHLSQAMRKLKVRDRLQAALYVSHHNLELPSIPVGQ